MEYERRQGKPVPSIPGVSLPKKGRVYTEKERSEIVRRLLDGGEVDRDSEEEFVPQQLLVEED